MDPVSLVRGYWRCPTTSDQGKLGYGDGIACPVVLRSCGRSRRACGSAPFISGRLIFIFLESFERTKTSESPSSPCGDSGAGEIMQSRKEREGSVGEGAPGEVGIGSHNAAEMLNIT